MKRMLIATAVLLTAACQPMPADGGRTDLAEATPAVQTPAGDDAAACVARGGKMLPQGRMQTLQCVVGYADGGRRCTDGDDCQGDCRVADSNSGGLPAAGASAVGQCQADSSRFGCYARVEDGRADVAICVD